MSGESKCAGAVVIDEPSVGVGRNRESEDMCLLRQGFQSDRERAVSIVWSIE